MKFNYNFFNTIKYNKYVKFIFIIFICLLILFFVNKFKENFTTSLVNATSCTQFSNCKDCTTGAVNNTSSPCYWSSQKNKCGSFQDPGYSRTCTITPTPTPGPTPTPTSGPLHCPHYSVVQDLVYTRDKNK